MGDSFVHNMKKHGFDKPRDLLVNSVVTLAKVPVEVAIAILPDLIIELTKALVVGLYELLKAIFHALGLDFVGDVIDGAGGLLGFIADDKRTTKQRVATPAAPAGDRDSLYDGSTPSPWVAELTFSEAMDVLQAERRPDANVLAGGLGIVVRWFTGGQPDWKGSVPEGRKDLIKLWLGADALAQWQGDGAFQLAGDDELLKKRLRAALKESGHYRPSHASY